MSKGKFVLRTTPLTGKPVFYFAVALGFSALAPMSAQAQAASDVYKKMNDVYSYAKSYQGTMTRSEVGKTQDGKSVSLLLVVKINFKAPNKFNVTYTRTVKANGKTQTNVNQMITDGKSMYLLVPEKKMYQRGPVQNENLLSRFFAPWSPANGFTLLPETKVDGRPAFAIKPNLPPNAKPEDVAKMKTANFQILIDKKNYQFLKLTLTGPNGTMNQTVSGQVLNGSVPDSLFVWSPPAGYKEVKPPTQSGAAPTIPGKAPGR